MKTSRYLWSGAAGLLVVIVALVLSARGQAPPAVAAPPGVSAPPSVIVEKGPDGTLIERTLDGRILRKSVGLYQATPNAANNPLVPQPPGYPVYGRPGMMSSPAGVPFADDPESQKLWAAEQAAAQEVRGLAVQAQKAASDGERADAKKKLGDALGKVFDLQQQRRAHEIAKIEERLARLKDTLKKRDAAKESIINRRLDVLTGGVDELGWEETLSGSPRYVPSGDPNSSYPRPGELQVAPGGLPTEPLIPAAPAPPR